MVLATILPLTCWEQGDFYRGGRGGSRRGKLSIWGSMATRSRGHGTGGGEFGARECCLRSGGGLGMLARSRKRGTGDREMGEMHRLESCATGRGRGASVRWWRYLVTVLCGKMRLGRSVALPVRGLRRGWDGYFLRLVRSKIITLGYHQGWRSSEG